MVSDVACRDQFLALSRSDPFWEMVSNEALTRVLNWVNTLVDSLAQKLSLGGAIEEFFNKAYRKYLPPKLIFGLARCGTKFDLVTEWA